MNSRRSFLKLAPALLGACALAPRLLANPAAAAPVEENDPAAAAIGYKKDAAAVDPKKYAQFKPGSTCANCALYTGKSGADLGPCMALAKRPVAATGWCMVWAAKP